MKKLLASFAIAAAFCAALPAAAEVAAPPADPAVIQKLDAMVAAGRERNFGTYQLGPKTSFSVKDVADAVRKSPLRDELKKHADAFGEEAILWSAGNVGVYNQACCGGILGLNRGAIAAHGMTVKEYVDLDLQKQVDIWAAHANRVAEHKAVRKVLARKSIDSRTAVQCIQGGVGNCGKPVKTVLAD
jgi:hypothetical protein